MATVRAAQPGPGSCIDVAAAPGSTLGARHRDLIAVSHGVEMCHWRVMCCVASRRMGVGQQLGGISGHSTISGEGTCPPVG